MTQFEELKEIASSPLAHVDMTLEVAKMAENAVERNWRRTNCPYFKDMTLENKFRRTWNERAGTIQNREIYFPAKIWLEAYDDRQEDYRLILKW